MTPRTHRPRYVRRADSQTWHFCRACSHYPRELTGAVVMTDAEPDAGSLCTECQAKTRKPEDQ